MKNLLKICVIIFSSLIYTNIKAQYKNFDSGESFIAVLYVRVDMNTFFRVNCDNFTISFKNLLSIQKVTDKDSLNEFLSIIKKVKFKKNYREIDVRRKFIYIYNDIQKNVLCSDGKNIIIDGRLIKRNKRLVKFLESMCILN
jgi:hypothetical protein